MKKGEIMGKIFGIALVFAVIGAMLLLSEEGAEAMIVKAVGK